MKQLLKMMMNLLKASSRLNQLRDYDMLQFLEIYP